MAHRLLAAGEGAGRRLALSPRRQFGRGERGAVEQVARAHFDADQAEAAQHLGDDRDTRDDHGRAPRREPGDAAALLDGESGEPCELILDRVGRDADAVDPLELLGRQPEVERGEGRGGAGDADDRVHTRGDFVRHALREHGRHGAPQPGDIIAEALGETDAAEVETDAEAVARLHELRRATTHVDDEHARLQVAADGDAPERERRLLVAAQEQGLEAVAPFDLAQEGLAVLGVADGAGGDGEHTLRAELLGDAPVAREDVAYPGHRHGEQAPPLVDALAEQGELESARELVDTPSVDVGDEQPGRVRAEVDRRDADHLRGTTPVTQFTVARTSATAAVSTASLAWLRASRASDADTRSPRSPSASAFGPMTSSLALTAAEASPATPENERNPRHASSPRTTTKTAEPTTAMSETASASQTQVTRGMLAMRVAVARRRRGLGQIAIVLAAVAVYEAFRIAITPDWDAALGNARQIWEWEQALAVNVEEPLQRAFLAIPDAVEALNVFYFVGHFLLTGLFFVWLYRRSANTFATFRNGFFVATSIALVVHWQFPTAPPRLADVGLVDTLRALSGVDIGSRSSEALSNPVFAVPSLHAGYAAAVGVGLVLYSSRRWVRVLGVVYPLLVVLTIMVTGNHFLFDAVAGLLVMAVGFGLASAVARLWVRDDGAILEPATRGGAVR